MQDSKKNDKPIVLGDSPVKTPGSKKLKQASLFAFAVKSPAESCPEKKKEIKTDSPVTTLPTTAPVKSEVKAASRKSGGRKKSLESQPKKAKLDKPQDLISDEEVTSSDQNCEKAGEVKTCNKSILEKFVRRESMQQDEVSTSSAKDSSDSFSLVAEELTQLPQSLEVAEESPVVLLDLEDDKKKDDSVECMENESPKVKAPETEADQGTPVKNQSNKCDENSESAVTPASSVTSENLDTSLATPDTSLSSVVTPKSSKSSKSVSTPDATRTPKSSKKPTPKQLEREAEMARRKQEREKQKLEKEKQKAQEKAEKEKLKKEKLEEKERQKQAELEAKEKKKEEERLRKEEEKQKKEEEKQKKEEEKKKKEDEKIQQEEQERLKKEKAKQAFQSFFTKRRSDVAVPTKDGEEVESAERFKPFRVKENMRLAPLVRSDFDEKRKADFDLIFRGGKRAEELYLDELKEGKAGKGSSEKIFWPAEKKDDDVEIIEEEGGDEESSANNFGEVIVVRDPLAKKRIRWKLLQFCENRRPAYWGTWTKTSSSVGPRRPFGKDQHFFDYEVDSDDEWEEEEPGESLSDSEGEQEPADDYEVDNEFFVPHGYLSDEEAEDEMEDMSPEARKEKLKMKEEDFANELKKKTKTLKPTLFGCMWEAESDSNPAYSHLQKILSIYRAVSIFPLPVCTSFGGIQPVFVEKAIPEGIDSEVVMDAKAKRKEMPEEDLIQLIKMIHGNRLKKDVIIKRFLEHWDTKYEGKTDAPKRPSKQKLVNKFKEIANYGKCAETNLGAWLVNQDVITKYDVKDLPELTTKKVPEVTEETPGTPANNSLITKYTQVMTPDELKVQQKKRVELITLSENKPSPAVRKPPGVVSLVNKAASAKTAAQSADKKARPAEGNSGEEPPAKKRVAFVTLSSPKKNSQSAALMDRFLNKTKDTSGSEPEKKTDEKEKHIEFVWIDD